MIAILRSFLLSFLLVAGFCAPALAQRVALVVGNSGYRHAPPLANPARDAELMAGALENAGFQVTRLIDADLAALKRAMLDFGRQLRDSEVEAGLFYYAGHGAQVKGENYLIPVSANIASEDEIDLEAVNINDFLAVMNSSKSRVNIVILDACRDNPFATASRGGPRGLAPVDAPKGTYIAYATSPGAVALDGAGDNSPYTTALAAAMREPGLPIERVFKNARAQVLAATDDRQLPWETSSITGEFFFHPGPATTAAKPKPEAKASDSIYQSLLLKDSPEKKPPEAGSGSDVLASLRLRESPRIEAPRWSGEVCSGPDGSSGDATSCVSSVLEPQFGNRYGPANLFDGNPATAWVEGAADDGLGEAIVLRFDEPRTVSRLSVMNGYNKNRDIYAKNNRVQTLKLTDSAGRRFSAALNDSGDWQTLTLPGDVKIEWLSLAIGSVYRGVKYRDTAISEIRVQ